MEKKIFWILFTLLSLLLFALPIWLNLVLTLPLLVFCWWVVYKSGWLN